MNYLELYDQAMRDLDHDRISFDEFEKRIKPLKEEVRPTGHWIEVAKYSDGRHEIECSKCGSHIYDRGHANSYVVKEKYKYCPRCGAKMESEVEK